LEPDVIFTRSTPATAALLKNTRSIPVVFAVVSDPVGDGFVGSGGLQIDHKLELLGELNRKISRSLGLIVSNQMQFLADEVIE
jgi:hypothetical protein